MNDRQSDLVLDPVDVLGGLERWADAAPISGATWYTAHEVGDGLLYRFPAGALAGAAYLSADLLVDGNRLAVFLLALQEGEGGPQFGMLYAALNQCSARIRAPLEAVNQNRWRYEREGAWLKPMVSGDRVDLARVDRMTVTILRKSDQPVHWCMTALTATAEAPPLLADLVLPAGPLIDDMGQSTLHEWPAKSRSHKEVTARLCAQLAAAPAQRWPARFSRWGGWTARRFEPTGFYRTHHDGRRWWLVDPDGYAFWSAGMDCVRVDTDAAYTGLEAALSWMPDPAGPYGAMYGDRAAPTINYLAGNLIRAFGPEVWHEHWATIALAQLRGMGFNTVANWSEWQIARQAGYPYVRPLALNWARTPLVYRDFPDVFDPGFERDVADYAAQLVETADDPALIGYFLMNEPTWGFARETPAAGMLYTTTACASREALAAFLRDRYETEAALSAAWGGATLAGVRAGAWHAPLNETAQRDLADFSARMVERLFGGLSQACKAVDPYHLNLGARYYTVPPDWAAGGMRHFDVFSMNCYRDRVPADEMSAIHEMLHMPILVGEWHFGALDAGLPASGIGHVRDQAARGQAFRFYTEDAAAKPWCVGVHYFTLYDESALGRFDGENWNIGFLDVCNRPYAPLAEAARATHERLYPVAAGEMAPYADAPEYLPKLFL
ncbi:MAG: hypothetical protein JXA09_07490 [Anaerolineae bacterium]|nr:hypothetical protein [Anaerolineae bacterium]